MAAMLPGLRFLDVDQIIETLPFLPSERSPLSKHLLTYAPAAYSSEGVPLTTIWPMLAESVQEAINMAWDREARIAYSRGAGGEAPR